eukprot:5576765-Heterocapsa_arctica.AAC.1
MVVSGDEGLAAARFLEAVPDPCRCPPPLVALVLPISLVLHRCVELFRRWILGLRPSRQPE